MLNEKLTTLKEQGMQTLIIDTRENRVPIDAYIPIDDSYIESVFGEEYKDYELEYVIEQY